MADTETPNKYLYSIGEVAEMFNLNTSAIRYWEKEFDIIKPHRNKKGNRLFTQEDVKNFRIIYHLVKERKMRIEGVKRKLSTSKEEIVNNIEIIDKLKSIKSLLLQISNEIDGDEN
ncbi:MAG: MerR family transcriptional regulator [Bacteroidales bacterium]|nr:MerR family transcriptional regulator [Bacteroidales bacterium]